MILTKLIVDEKEICIAIDERYSTEEKQKLYNSCYLEGWETVLKYGTWQYPVCENSSATNITDLAPEEIDGYFEGIKRAIAYQRKQEKKDF